MKSLTREGWDALESGSSGVKGDASGKGKDKEIKCFSTRAVESFEVLNDLVVDRGPSPYVSQLELFGEATFSVATCSFSEFDTDTPLLRYR